MDYLGETYYFNYTDPVIQEFIADVPREISLKEQAIHLYPLVRDGWRYDPYNLYFQKNDFRASTIMGRQTGHCLDKSIIMVACARALGIPARIHLAKVKNHIGVERIIETIGSDELSPHGFVELFLEGKWVSCTPAFNKSLCGKLNVAVLEFDGENDSIFQAFNKTGDKFMEYLADYGHFEDFPYEFVLKNLAAHYPHYANREEVQELLKQ